MARNPVMRVEKQLQEVYRIHARSRAKNCRGELTALLEELRVPDAGQVLKKYPFELIMLNQMLSAKSIYWEKHGLIPIWTTIAELPTVLLGLR